MLVLGVGLPQPISIEADRAQTDARVKSFFTVHLVNVSLVLVFLIAFAIMHKNA